MRSYQRLLAVVVPLATVACTGIQYLTVEPPAGAIPTGKIVYVDDGTCPQGEVKEVTGGSLHASIPRTVRCVERPQ
jgi:Family of unknown function (DUF6719)